MQNDWISPIKNNFPPDFISQKKEDLSFYGHDWAIEFPARPSAVVFPRSTQDVSRLLALCTHHRIPVVPSGGRTGLSGGASAPQGELVLSLSRMNRIGSVCTLSQTLEVEAGAVTEAVHNHCKPYGLTWPVDFASKGSSQVGGNISTNAGGVNVIRYGNTRNWVLGLEVVTMQGQILPLGGGLEKNNSGIDLRQLFIGSEGVLGVITQATLKLSPVQRSPRLFFFGMKNLASVFHLCRLTRESGIDLLAYETFDQGCFEASCQKMGISNPFPALYPWYVLVEVESGLPVDSWLTQVLEKNFARNSLETQSTEESRKIWKIRESIAESLALIAPYHKNDVSVPVSRLESFLADYHQLFHTATFRDLAPYTFGHIGDGNLHINTLNTGRLSEAVFQARVKEFDEALYALVKTHGGTISGEHGVGLLKKNHLFYTRTPQEISLMREIKKIFDPLGLLNPGKVIPSE